MEPTEVKPELTPQEIRNILAFMERSQIVGKEAFVYVQLVTKLMKIMNSEQRS